MGDNNNELNGNIVPQSRSIVGNNISPSIEQVPNLQEQTASQQPSLNIPVQQDNVFVSVQPVVNKAPIVQPINTVIGQPNDTISTELPIENEQSVEVPNINLTPAEASSIIPVPLTIEQQPLNIPMQQNNVVVPTQPEKKPMNKKRLFIVLGIILSVILVAVIIILFLNNNSKEEEKNEPITPPIEENEVEIKLICTKEELLGDLKNKITYTHLYENNIYTRVEVEDEIIFTDDTIQYYDYYMGSAREQMKYEKQAYDNITIEVRGKESSVSLIYSFDLTASPGNPNNMLDDKDMTLEEMEQQMFEMGFICE